MALMKKITIFSPHLDDAVLDCADHIKQWLNQKHHVHVITIFSKFGTSSPTQDTSDYLHQSGFSDTYSFEKARIQEDIQAMNKLGVSWEHLGYIDGGFRRNPQPVYSNYQQLFSGHVKHEDKPILTSLQHTLSHQLKATNLACIPLGIGNHADHIITRRVVENLMPAEQIIYYVDYPYCLNYTNWTLATIAKVFFLRKSFIFTSQFKSTILGCYSSQIPLLFTSQPLYPEVIVTHNSSI